MEFIGKVVSSEPVLTPEVAALARAVADRYAGMMIDVLRLAIPPRHAKVEAEPPAETPRRRPSGPTPRPGAGYPRGPAFVEALRNGRQAHAVWQALPGEDWPARLAELAATAAASDRGAVLVVPDYRDVARLHAACVAQAGADNVVALSADAGPGQAVPARGSRSSGAPPGSSSAPGPACSPPCTGPGCSSCGTTATTCTPTRTRPTRTCATCSSSAPTPAAPRCSSPGSRGPPRRSCSSSPAGRPRSSPAATSSGRPRRGSPRSARPTSSSPGTRPPARPASRRSRSRPPGRRSRPGGRCSCRCRAAATCPRSRASSAGPRPAAGAAPARSALPASGADARPPTCRWCGVADTAFRCGNCGSRRLRAIVVGAKRTAEELGRAFADVPVLGSGGAEVLDAGRRPAGARGGHAGCGAGGRPAATAPRCCSTAGRCSAAPTCGPPRRRCAAG